LVPVEIDQIECTRACGHRAPDLHVPRRRQEIALTEGRVQSRANVKRLASEAIQAEALVVPKAAHFRADKHIRHDLHCKGGCDAERGIAESLSGGAYARLRGLVAEVERGEQPTRYQLAIGKRAKRRALLVGRRPARVVGETPVRLDAYRQAERRVLAIEQAVSRVEGNRLQSS